MHSEERRSELEYDEDVNLDRGQDPWNRRKARPGSRGQFMPAWKNSGVSLHGHLPTLNSTKVLYRRLWNLSNWHFCCLQRVP